MITKCVFCINRNIVECKEWKWLYIIYGLLSINRNIVECKVVLEVAQKKENKVLIETSWNVKMDNSIFFSLIFLY